jgi:Flp pilus assembly secretin CpaC
MKFHGVLCAAVMGVAVAATAAIAGEPARLYVTIDKAEVINFPSAPFSKVAVTNPNIADVHVLTPTQLLLNGRVAGTTSLLVFYPGRVEYFDVVVHPGPMGNSRARLVPTQSHVIEIQRGAKVSEQLFVRDEDKAWVQLGDHNGKAEPREAPAK